MKILAKGKKDGVEAVLRYDDSAIRMVFIDSPDEYPESWDKDLKNALKIDSLGNMPVDYGSPIHAKFAMNIFFNGDCEWTFEGGEDPAPPVENDPDIIY